MNIYALIPTNGRKSFYGKAKVIVNDNGDHTLYSYDTKIITRTATGALIPHWDGWTATTGAHIKSFCGLNKAQYFKLLEG